MHALKKGMPFTAVFYDETTLLGDIGLYRVVSKSDEKYRKYGPSFMYALK